MINEPTMGKSFLPHLCRKCDILNISLNYKVMSVIFPLMQRITVISNEHDGSLDQCTYSMNVGDLKTSNNSSCIFFVMGEKQHVSQKPKGQKASLTSMTTTCMSFFQTWVNQLIIGKQGKKETKYFVSVPGTNIHLFFT